MEVSGHGDNERRCPPIPLNMEVTLYWDRPLPIIVQYHGNGSPLPNLNSTNIQTLSFEKHDSNSQFWAPISTFKWGMRALGKAGGWF